MNEFNNIDKNNKILITKKLITSKSKTKELLNLSPGLKSTYTYSLNISSFTLKLEIISS